MRLYILKDEGERLYELFVGYGPLAVAGDVHTVDLIQDGLHIFKIVQVRNRNDAHARLLQELYVCLWHV